MAAIEIYQTDQHAIEIRLDLEHDTLWLTQKQMADLFDRDSDTIGLHLKNIFNEGELDAEATTEDSSVVRQEGKRQVKRKIKRYNLDAILSVGYRVNSKKGTQFRQWATRTLKQHLIEGYTLNERRLQERGIEMEEVLGLLSKTLENQQLVSDTGAAVVSVIHDYARSWSLLQAYDEQSLTDITYKQPDMQALDFNDVLRAIAALKKELMSKGEATALFGQLRGEGLASSIATIEQGFGDELFYPNVASRAANLLYLVIKNHPLADGNKRTQLNIGKRKRGWTL